MSAHFPWFTLRNKTIVVRHDIYSPTMPQWNQTATCPTQIIKSRRKSLPNGLVVITEPMEHVHSVSVGIWLRTGSRREPAALNGISHFIEHMVFKGTTRRTAEDIAREVDSVGGMLDAFTSKEMVCFNTRVLDEHLPKAFDVLADMVLEPKFAEDEIEREKSVILEEIRMTQDNPEDLVHELFTQNFWSRMRWASRSWARRKLFLLLRATRCAPGSGSVTRRTTWSSPPRAI